MVTSGCRVDREYDDGLDAETAGNGADGSGGSTGGRSDGSGITGGDFGPGDSGVGGNGGNAASTDGGDDGDGNGSGDGTGGSKASSSAGSAGSGGNGDDGPFEVFAGATKGSAAALTPDGLVGAVVNRDAGSVTIVALESDAEGEPPRLSVVDELDLGKGSEPWQVAIGPDGESAYVVLREAQELVRIDDLYGEPEVGGSVAVGSEPTAVSLSPTGRVAYVANWNDGTVLAVSTDELEVVETYDLNEALVKTGYLGEVEARPALAHPRSIAVTNDGDQEDSDEHLYVTEYFGQQVEEIDVQGANADVVKVGLVYAVDLESGGVSTIPLSPLADMGFLDNNGEATGCFPNQLQDIAIQGEYAYVISVCASPKGPIGFKTNTAPLVSVISLESGREVEGGGQSLNAMFDARFNESGVPDDASRRFPLLANDIAFVPGTTVGYVSAGGADAVFRFEVSAEDGRVSAVGASTNHFINLSPAGIDSKLVGQRPVGLVVSPTNKKAALVVNEVSRTATVLDFNTQAVAGGAEAPHVVQTAEVPAAGSDGDAVRRGKRFFTTGLARWSLNGQAWGACESCHTDGLTDNVTWHFARGARQSIAMDGTFASSDPSDQRIMNWTTPADEVHDFELNTRNVSGGVGAGVDAISNPLVNDDRIDLAAVGAANLAGSAAQAMDPSNPLGFAGPPLLNDWNEINRYVQTLRTPRRPSNLSQALVDEGRDIFLYDGACQGCHSGENWTISQRFYEPSTAVNQALAETFFAVPAGFPKALLPSEKAENQRLRFGAGDAAVDQIQCVNREVGTFGVAEAGVGVAELRQDMLTPSQGAGNEDGEGSGYNVPSLLGVATGAPYLHAGGARTLEALFADPFGTHARALAPNLFTETDAEERAGKVRALVEYLLTIDEDADFPDIPTAGAKGGQICEAAKVEY